MSEIVQLAPKKIQLQPPHCLVMGPAGSGKTTSIATFAKAGIECFVLITEPTGVDALLDAWEREHLDIDLLHYCVVAPASPGWQGLKDLGIRVNAMSYSDIANLKSGIGKEQMKQFPKLLANLENFHDERTGRDYGDVTSWSADRCLALDSLSGLSLIALQHTVGFKPSPHQGEWGIAMSATEMLLLKLSSDLHCFFLLTAHIEKEPDEITGMAKVGVSTLGKKLAPKIPRFFSEVVRARKGADGRYLWATQDSEADLKNRALPASGGFPQDFGPVIEAFRRREKQAQS
jgi:AAA domain